jgi:hypothetical protein
VILVQGPYPVGSAGYESHVRSFQFKLNLILRLKVILVQGPYPVGSAGYLFHIRNSVLLI